MSTPPQPSATPASVLGAPVRASPLPAPPADALRGILWMLLTMLLFVSLDAVAKHLMRSYPPALVVWGRFVFHMLLVALWLGPHLGGQMRSRRPGLQLVRSLLLLLTTFLFFLALRFMPLVNAGVIMFVGPLLVTVLSIPLLGEQVGARRWAGVVIGFLGALIVIRPGAASMEPAALLVLGAAGCNALYHIATRRLSHFDPPLTTLCYTALVGALASSAIVPFFWTSPDAAGWLLMAAAGFLGGTGHFCLIKAFQHAPASVIAPFSYSSLVWATLLGFVFFGDLPDGWTLIGAFVIIASGLYVFHRERVRAGDGR